MHFKISNFFADFLDYCVSFELVRFQRAHSLPPLIWVLCELAIILLSFVWTKVIKFAFCTVVLPNFNSFKQEVEALEKILEPFIQPARKGVKMVRKVLKVRNRQTGFPENDSQTQLWRQLTLINICLKTQNAWK